MTDKHKHADLMLQYALDAMETYKPWKRWQVKVHTGWESFQHEFYFNIHREYRRRPDAPPVPWNLLNKSKYSTNVSKKPKPIDISVSEWKAFAEILPEIGKLMADDPERGYKRVERRCECGKRVLAEPTSWANVFLCGQKVEYRIKPRTIRLQEECKKPVDLSFCIESGIDMEVLVNFGATEYWVVAGPLRKISSDGDYYFDGGPAANCRPRMEHWMVWQSGECPVPEGVMGNIMFRDGTVSPDLRLWTCYWEHGGHGGDIIAFRVTGLADGYYWP